MKQTNLEDLNIFIIILAFVIAGWCVLRDFIGENK